MLVFVISIIAFFVLLSVLIFIHEFGHFYAARRAGIIVEEFGIGIPPRALLMFESKGTKFTLNWIPFGGFVKLKGEGSLDPNERNEPGSFASASLLARFVVLIAGVFMNLVLAFLLFSAVYSVGGMIPKSMTEEEFKAEIAAGDIQTASVVAISETAEAVEYESLEQGMLVTAINGIAIETIEEVTAILSTEETSEISVKEKYTAEESIKVLVNNTLFTEQYTLLDALVVTETSPRSYTKGLAYSFKDSWHITITTVKGMGELFRHIFRYGKVPEGVSGPLGIAKMTHLYVQEGIWHYLWLMAVISLSLAALNILPFPPLDGGRLVFVVVEAVIRRPVNRKMEIIINEVGFLFLLLLLIFVTFNDIFSFF